MLLQMLLTIQTLLYQIQDTIFKTVLSEQLHQEKIKTAKCERIVSVFMKKASAQTSLYTFFHSFVQLPSMLFKNHKFRLADLLALSVNEGIFNVTINSTWDYSNDKLILPVKYVI
jgi:hypothetical protein